MSPYWRQGELFTAWPLRPSPFIRPIAYRVTANCRARYSLLDNGTGENEGVWWDFLYSLTFSHFPTSLSMPHTSWTSSRSSNSSFHSLLSGLYPCWRLLTIANACPCLRSLFKLLYLESHTLNLPSSPLSTLWGVPCTSPTAAISPHIGSDHLSPWGRNHVCPSHHWKLSSYTAPGT